LGEISYSEVFSTGPNSRVQWLIPVGIFPVNYIFVQGRDIFIKGRDIFNMIQITRF